MYLSRPSLPPKKASVPRVQTTVQSQSLLSQHSYDKLRDLQ